MNSPRPRPTVSLVVTVLNEASCLPGLLTSIEMQTIPPDEVVVVDGGSHDGTWEMLVDWAAGRPTTQVSQLHGANISQGRNRAIEQASGEIIAVTDAGVELEPTWLGQLVRPLADDPDVAVSSGFFVADPRSVFERAMGATVLPAVNEIDPARFLPSSRSVAFRREAWERVRGYPEWLDYCEDVVFDQSLHAAGYKFAWAPDALVRFRPRGDFDGFFRQYYRYARGDGKADLWRGRHAMRYAAYAVGVALLWRSRSSPLALAVLTAGGGIYLRRPLQRLLASPSDATSAANLAQTAALVPMIRLVGDVAKMLGYPAGVAWRLSDPRHLAPPSRNQPESADLRRGSTTCDLSVIIVNYNTRERLKGCLASLRQSRGVGDIETFVVDNASDDGSAEMVASEFPWVRLIRSDVNGGYAYANNLALRETSGRKILLLNPDTELGETALSELVSYLDAHPETGAVGPKLVRGDGSLDLACRRSFPTPSVAFYRMAGLSRLFPKSRRFGRYNLTYLDSDEETEVDALTGACMLVRREAIEDVGLLDERFFMYGEDLDWAYRIKSLGWTIRYNPKVVVLHYKGEASRQSSERATVAFYRAMHLFYAKHYRGKSFPGVDWAILAGIYGRMAWSLAKNALRPPEQRRVAT